MASTCGVRGEGRAGDGERPRRPKREKFSIRDKMASFNRIIHYPPGNERYEEREKYKKIRKNTECGKWHKAAQDKLNCRWRERANLGSSGGLFLGVLGKARSLQGSSGQGKCRLRYGEWGWCSCKEENSKWNENTRRIFVMKWEDL